MVDETVAVDGSTMPFIPTNPLRNRPIPSTRPSTRPSTLCTTTPPPPPTPQKRTRRPVTLLDHAHLKPHHERTLLLQIRVLQTINTAESTLHTKLSRPPTISEIATHLGLTTGQLHTQKHAGIRARNDLVAHHLRLVVRIATMVHTRLSRQTPANIPLEDLVQEGCVALIKAAEMYNLDSSAKFSTFAWTVVYNACMREGPRGSIVTIPERLRQASRKVVHAVPEHLLEAAGPHLRGALALDAPVHPTGGGKSFVELMEGKELPEEVVHRQLVAQEIRTAIYTSLSERYADVLIMRFGLNGSPPMAGKDIAKLYGLSEPRIAQIVLAALEKLRKSAPDLAHHISDL